MMGQRWRKHRQDNLSRRLPSQIANGLSHGHRGFRCRLRCTLRLTGEK